MKIKITGSCRTDCGAGKSGKPNNRWKSVYKYGGSMKLNLSVLKNELQQSDLHTAHPDVPFKLKFSYPVLVDRCPETLSGDILYIAESDLLSDRLPVTGDGIPSVLCSGRPPKTWLSANIEIVYTEQTGIAALLMNQTVRICARYNQWEQKMQWILDEKRPLRELAEVTSELLGNKNPIWAIGASFRYNFSYVPEQDPLTPQIRKLIDEHPPQTGDAMTPEEIEELLTDPEYQNTMNEADPIIYSGLNEGYRTLTYNLFVNDVLLARIGFQEISSLLTERDYAVILVLGQYVKKALITSGTNAFDRPLEMDQTLRALAANIPVTREKVEEIMKHCRWQENDRFICLSVKLRGRVNSPQSLTDTCLLLASLLGNDCYTIFEDRIIYVFDLSRPEITRRRLLETLLPILRDNLLEAGVSTTFNNFQHLHYFNRQAETARATGNLKDPTYWYFYYEDYQTEDLLDRYLKDTVPETLIPDGLKALLAYDRKKGTNYAPLLRIYLESERNIARTIRRAYIHRNTFLYRIDRIEKILELDLEDPQNRLILELAFRVIERYKDRF